MPFSQLSLLKVSEPQRGDIVVFNSDVAGKKLVKRVIGTPGDEVALIYNTLYINGERVSYDQIDSTETTVDKTEYLLGDTHAIRVSKNKGSPFNLNPIQVPEGHYFVLGDNRDNSADSRVIGFVPRNEIVGRSKNVVLSLDYDNYYLPRAERFFRTL